MERDAGAPRIPLCYQSDGAPGYESIPNQTKSQGHDGLKVAKMDILEWYLVRHF